MAVVRGTDHAIQAGTVTIASFNSTHKIVNFPVQTDQGVYQIPWATPTLTPEMYPVRAIDRGLSGRGAFIGFYKFTWTFDKWTALMWKHFDDTFFNEAAWAPVTVRTYSQREEAMYLTCRMQRPVQLNPIRGAGFTGVKIEFLFCEILEA